MPLLVSQTIAFRKKYLYFVLLKSVAFIMIFSVTVSSVYPCCAINEIQNVKPIADETICCSEHGCGENEMSHKNVPYSDSPRKNCSPFFTCCNCAGFLPQTTGNIVCPAPLAMCKVTCHLGWVPTEIEFTNKPWQPPKMI